MTREEIIEGLRGMQGLLPRDPMTKLSGIMSGAAELLTPRVLSLNEIPEHDGAVFIEYENGDEDWALYMYEDGPFFKFRMMAGGVMLPLEDYGVGWRCWTGRPGAEQRWHS